MRRPMSVTVICWILIIFCSIGLLTLLSTLADPIFGKFFGNSDLPISAMKIGGALGYVVAIVCAIFMLRGANWARWLYLGWVAIGLLSVSFSASSLLLVIPGALKTIVFAYFLTRSDASAFFKSVASPSDTSSDVDAA
jgi:hypothetical protein